LSQLLSKVSVTSCRFPSNVQCVRLAAKQRTLKMCRYKSRPVFSCCFEDTDISQGSVATHLRRGGIFSDSTIYIFAPDSHSDKGYKICQYLTKI